MRGIHRWPVNSPHKWPVTRKMSPFDDVTLVGHILVPCKSNLLVVDWYAMIGDSQLSHNALDKYPTMPHFETEMCAREHFCYNCALCDIGLVHSGISTTGLFISTCAYMHGFESLFMTQTVWANWSLNNKVRFVDDWNFMNWAPGDHHH